MIIKGYETHNICIGFFSLIQIILNYLLVAVDDELLIEGWLTLLSQHKLLICFILILHPLY